MFSATKLLVAGAIVVLFGGALLITQPFAEQGSSVPGAAVDGVAATPVEFTATIDYGNGTGPDGEGFPVVSSDSRFQGRLTWTATRKTYPGVAIELEAASSRIENEGGAWESGVGLQLANLPDDESPDFEPPLGRQTKPESDAVTYVGVDGYEGLFIVAEATWDVMTLTSDIHGYVFEGELALSLGPQLDVARDRPRP